MCPQQKVKDKTTVLQMNSEIQHAHLELLSAHCAVHQLRLHYSSDDLIRFGRGDVLRTSAQAASALHEFYSAIQQRITATAPSASALPEPSPEQVAQAVAWLCGNLRENRERYLPATRPLTREEVERFSPYFSDSVLNGIRIAELHGARVPVPDFFDQARAMGYDNLPDIAHMDSLTFSNVIVFNESLSERALFHGLVHAVQIRVLGLERYAELWVRAFARSRAHFTVPLEVHAFSLSAKFLLPEHAPFSVENEAFLWAAERRY
jgi:hypothetical protein